MLRIEAPTVDLAAAFRALDRAVLATCDDDRHPFTTIQSTDDGIFCSFDGQPFRVWAHIPATVHGSGVLHLPSTIVASVLSVIDDEHTTLECTEREIRIQSERTRFGIVVDPVSPAAVMQRPPQTGCAMASEDYLQAFRRVATATLGGQTGHELEPLVITQDGEFLNLRYDTFDVIASDSIPVGTGSVGAPLAVPVRTFRQAVAQFMPAYRHVEIGSEDAKTVWLTTEHERHGYRIAFGLPTWQHPVRNIAQLAPEGPIRTASIPARRLRPAMRRVAISLNGGSTGTFLTLRFSSARQTVRLLTHGWFAAAAEEVACRFDGDDLEVTLRYTDLWHSIRRMRDQVGITIGDPAKPIAISDRHHYRCVLRPLPPAELLGPQHNGIGENMPHPRATT